MSLGVTLSASSIASTSDTLTAVGGGGTGPYTYAFYRSTTTGFTPGTGNKISGSATIASFNDSGLTPGTVYYYAAIVTDTGNSGATATSSQITVTTLAPSLSQNQFQQQAMLGQVDLKFAYNTIEVQFDPAGTGTLVPGQAVIWSTVAGGAPKVLPSTATSDVVAGFVNLNNKIGVYNPGDRLNISMSGNVIYLYAATAVNRGQQVTSLVSGVAGGCNGGVIPSVSSGGLPKVGFALDTGAIGQLIRIHLQTPAYILS